MEEIKELVKAVEESGINELEIEKNGSIILIRKGMPIVTNKEKNIAEKNTKVVVFEESEKKYPDNWKEIVAPMVGTFYRAPQPDADPYVKVGDKVEAGQAVCILEAMGLKDEIKAEEPGLIKKILVDNGKAVGYGEVLFLYKPLEELEDNKEVR